MFTTSARIGRRGKTKSKSWEYLSRKLVFDVSNVVSHVMCSLAVHFFSVCLAKLDSFLLFSCVLQPLPGLTTYNISLTPRATVFINCHLKRITTPCMSAQSYVRGQHETCRDQTVQTICGSDDAPHKYFQIYYIFSQSNSTIKS